MLNKCKFHERWRVFSLLPVFFKHFNKTSCTCLEESPGTCKRHKQSYPALYPLLLTLILLTRRKWWAPNNARKQQMGFNSAFKGLTINLPLSFSDQWQATKTSTPNLPHGTHAINPNSETALCLSVRLRTSDASYHVVWGRWRLSHSLVWRSIGCGFSPPQCTLSARRALTNVQTLLQKMD